MTISEKRDWINEKTQLNVPEDEEIVQFYYKAVHDHAMLPHEADDYAYLNTMFRYDIGAEAAKAIIGWYYNNQDTTVQDAVTAEGKGTLENICQLELGLHLDFSHFAQEEQEWLEYGFAPYFDEGKEVNEPKRGGTENTEKGAGGKETLRGALSSQEVFPGYDALGSFRKEANASMPGRLAEEALSLPLDGFTAINLHTDISIKNELCVAACIEGLKDKGLRGEYPTSLHDVEERVQREIAEAWHSLTRPVAGGHGEEAESARPQAGNGYFIPEGLAECKAYLSARKGVLKGYLDGIIGEIEEAAEEEYLDMVETDGFAPEEGDTVKDLDAKVRSALGELLEGAEDFYVKSLPDYLGMSEEDARHFGFPIEEEMKKEKKKAHKR